MGTKQEECHDYESAVSMLFSQQAMDRESIVAASKRRTCTVEDMREYMRRIGIRHDNSEQSFQDVIHITGTKGKGSTCSMVESIVRRAHKKHTGMFTSPHLVEVTERIRLDGLPVQKREFAEAYFEVRRRLLSSQPSPDCEYEGTELPVLPGYFRMVTLVGMFIFANHKFCDGQKVDVTILEVGMGGRYDATNVFQHATVCGISLIDYDHMRVLGDTLEQIAWEKAGIIKKPSPAKIPAPPNPPADVLTVSQNTPQVLQVIRDSASQACAQLHVTSPGEHVPSHWPLGLAGDYQRHNAELAASLCHAWAEKKGLSQSTEATKNALRHAAWPGRCQTVPVSQLPGFSNDLNLFLHCDGAHTERSMESALEWFRKTISTPPQSNTHPARKTALIFYCSHERNPVTLLRPFFQTKPLSSSPLQETLLLFDEVHFCKPNSERPSVVVKSTAKEYLAQEGFVTKDTAIVESEPSWLHTLASIWRQLEQHREKNLCIEGKVTEVHAGQTVHDAIHSLAKKTFTSDVLASDGDCQVDVFVTGSLYVVGAALQVSSWTEQNAKGQLDFDKT